MKSYTVTLGGQTFQIKSDASEEHVHDLAKSVTSRYLALEKKGPRGTQDLRAMAMVALMLADELSEAAAKMSEAIADRDFIKTKAQDFARAMIQRIDEILEGDKS